MCAWQSAINLSEVLALGVLLIVVLCRALNTPNAFLRHNYLWILNISLGALCLASLGTFVAAYCKRVLKAIRWAADASCTWPAWCS